MKYWKSKVTKTGKGSRRTLGGNVLLQHLKDTYLKYVLKNIYYLSQHITCK